MDFASDCQSIDGQDIVLSGEDVRRKTEGYMKKRLLILLVAAALILPVCSCNKAKEEPSVDAEETEEYDGDAELLYNKHGSYMMKLGTLIDFDDCYCDAQVSMGDYYNWTIYNGDHEIIACQFGFGCVRGPVYYLVDVDGDGNEEMICNCMYSGDGAARAFIYRNNNGVVEVGRLDEDRMAERIGDELCVLSFDIYYDADSKEFVFENYFNDDEYSISIDDFYFTEFDPDHCF